MALWIDSNHLDMFMTDLQGVVWSTWWESGPGWEEWFYDPSGNKVQSRCEVKALWVDNNHLDLFVTDNFGVVWSTWFENGKGGNLVYNSFREHSSIPGAAVTAQWTTSGWSS